MTFRGCASGRERVVECGTHARAASRTAARARARGPPDRRRAVTVWNDTGRSVTEYETHAAHDA